MSVAVIIPNRNNAALLERCLRSVTDDPAVAEILVYDDCSTDGSVGVIEGIRHTGIKLIRGNRPVGAGRGRDILISKTHQPYLSFLDADDFLAHRTISLCLEQAIAGDLDMSVPEHVKISTDGTRKTPFLAAPRAVMNGQEALIANLGLWLIGAPHGLVRREIYMAAVDGFDFYGYSDDELLTRKMLLASKRIGGAAGTYFYRFDDREPSLQQKIARLHTSIRSLSLAQSVRREDWRNILRAHRNHVVMEVFRLALANFAEGVPTAQLLREVDDVGIPWLRRDAPPRLLVRLLRARR